MSENIGNAMFILMVGYLLCFGWYGAVLVTQLARIASAIETRSAIDPKGRGPKGESATRQGDAQGDPS